MTSISANRNESKAQTYRVTIPFGHLVLAVDEAGDRWVPLAHLSEVISVPMGSLLAKVDKSARYWGYQNLDVPCVAWRLCLPMGKVTSLLLTIKERQVPSAKWQVFRWLQANAHKALHGFHIPEPEKPLIVEEPEPEPVAIAPKVETGLQTFNFGSLPVRVVMREGEPWWMAADVCAVLDIQNPTDALTRLDEDEKGTLDSTEGGPGRRIVSESGLYSLVLGSRKPEALRYALSRQRDRRNLTDADLVRLVGELDKRKHREDNLKRGVEIPEAPCGVSEEPARSSSKTAKILGISERKVEDSTLEQNQAPNVTPFLRPWRGPRGDGGAA